MKSNIYQKKLINKNKIPLRKPSYRYFADKSFKNIDNNTSYASSDEDEDKENESSIPKETKENNENKNKIKKSPNKDKSDTINKENNKIFNKSNTSSNLIFNKKKEIENNYPKQVPIKLNKNMSNSKFHTINAYHPNSNIAQLYNFNALNRNQLQTNNHLLNNPSYNLYLLNQTYDRIRTQNNFNAINAQNRIINNNRTFLPKYQNNLFSTYYGNLYNPNSSLINNRILSQNQAKLNDSNIKDKNLSNKYNNNINNGVNQINNKNNITNFGVNNPALNSINNNLLKNPNNQINNQLLNNNINNLNNINPNDNSNMIGNRLSIISNNNNLQNNIKPSLVKERINPFPSNNNLQNNINPNNLISNRLSIIQNNNASQKNLLNNLSNINSNNITNKTNIANTNLNQVIEPATNKILNQGINALTNQEINNILNNANPSFQTIKNNQSDLLNLYNQQQIKQTNDLKLREQQINQGLSSQKNQQQNNLMNAQPLNQYVNNNYNNLIGLRTNLSNDNIFSRNNNYINNQANQKINLLLNNYGETQNKFMNEPQTILFSQDKNYVQSEINMNSPQIPLLKNFAVLSRPGNDKTGMTKTNQDTLISKTNINNIKDFNIFGVLDGHGPTGHLISQFAGQFIPNCIINNPDIRRQTNPESIYFILRQNNYQIINQAFIAVDNKLQAQNFDSKESGSTCVLIIHIGNHIICANVGDSRAIAVFDEKNDGNLNYLKSFPLSIDYKPDLPEEKNRILMSGGWVEQIKNSFGEGIGPYRVFAPGEDYPGLAMSRSIGDQDGKKFGVIPDPGIIEYNINRNTKYIVLCSDGVWEFLSNEHVKNIGKEFYLNNNPKGFVQELITQSVIEWESNDIVIDDITAIALFF